MACGHGCVYCDGRAERYYVAGDFERDIVVRHNLPDLLRNEISKLREPGIISIGSGVSDAYQPVEQDEGLTRRCAEVLADAGYPVTLMTKSSLIERDAELWGEVNRKGLFLMTMSLTFANDELRAVFEPRASSVESRLATLAAFKDAGCAVGVLAMPFLPYLSDNEENLRQLFGRLADIGVDFVMPGSLTLRPGKQRDFYMDVIRRKHPDLIPRYKELYREDRQSGAPINSYGQAVYDRAQRLLLEYGLPSQVPHRVYAGHLMVYDEIHVLMQHMTELYSNRGIDTRPLRRSAKGYRDWLVEKKQTYNRRRSLQYEDLAEEVREAFRSGHMASVLNNPKLAEFLGSVVLKRRVFDYVELKLLD